MKWTTEKPKKIGWYWVKEIRNIFESDPYIVKVRLYGGELAIQNATLSNWECKRYIWSGPIQEPTEYRNGITRNISQSK